MLRSNEDVRSELDDARRRELIALTQTEPLRAVQQIMALLRSEAGCPWDREQTFTSLRRHTLEEVYEVFDALERRAWPELQEELGDLLLQVLFYAQMAEDEGRFDLADVARTLGEKLIRRHPHIFADTQVGGSGDVIRNWDAIKRQEKSARQTGAPESLLAGVLVGTPALMEAHALQSKAAKVRFDWERTADVIRKIREELDELEAEIATAAAVVGVDGNAAALAEELGDVIFSVANLARHLGADAEMTLRDANRKFRGRFEAMEMLAAETGRLLAGSSAAELDALWAEVKRRAAQNKLQADAR